jgi:hypothetical protein
VVLVVEVLVQELLAQALLVKVLLVELAHQLLFIPQVVEVVQVL